MNADDKGFGFKITIIGDAAVGKTSLIKNYTQGSFQKDYISTLGTQFSKYEEVIDGDKVELFLWDIAGQDSFEVLRQRFYTGSSGAIIVFSHAPEQIKSYDNLNKWLSDIKKHCGDLPVALFGNKVDLVNEKKLDDSKIDSLRSDLSFIGHYYTSAKTGKNVLDAFQSLVKVIYQS